MSKISIIGAGFIGRAWAICFARAGHDVWLYDREDGVVDLARSYVADVLPSLEEYDLINGQTPEAVLSRLHQSDSLRETMEGAVHVQENTPENLEIKRAVFAELEQNADPETVLASSTSAILPSLFSKDLETRDRCLVAHPINPPYLVPAVEVVPSEWTSPDTREATAELMRGIGQKPIIMQREIDGFVMNRMQGALLEEAFRLVHDGYVTAEEVDVGIRDGLALRWSFMGPFETIDLNAPGGVRDYAVRYQKIYEKITPTQARRVDWTGPVLDRVESDLRSRVAERDLPERQQWRDRRLMALAAHKRQAESDTNS